MKSHKLSDPVAEGNVSEHGSATAPGKSSRVAQRYGHLVQYKLGPGGGTPVSKNEVAATGFQDAARPVPFRSYMEAGFGTSFSGVQCYMGESARAANETMGSKAYAVGNQVAFGDANPSREVVAHELAHTVQQTGGTPTMQAKSDAPSHSSYEAEADAAAASVVAGGKASVVMRTGGTGVQRWGGSDHYMMGNLGGQKAVTRLKAASGGKLPSLLPTKKVEIARAGDKKKGEKEIKKTQGETIAMNTARTTTLKPHLLSPGIKIHRKGQLGLGGASRIGGDYVKTPGELGKIVEGDLYESTLKMIQIASTNSNHFYPLNHAEYWAKHNAAMKLAQQAFYTAKPAEKKKLINQALIMEGFACHFLQDTFASGHHAPRALDAMTSWFSNTRESKKGLSRTKPWHDFFCMLPNGLPTDQGRFHGDNYMDGNDLEKVSAKTAESMFQVLSMAFNATAAPAPKLPVPDFAGIMADPVAGPPWRAMIGKGGSDLDGFGADMKGAKKRGDGYTTSGGVKQSNSQVLGPMARNIFGAGATEIKLAKATAGNVKTSLNGIKHMLTADFKANIHTRESDDNSHAPKKPCDEHFNGTALESKFKMYSGLQELVGRWKAGMKAQDPKRKVADWLLGRIKVWLAKVKAFSLSSGIKGAAITALVKADIETALGSLGGA